MNFAQALAQIEALIQMKVESKTTRYSGPEWVAASRELDRLLYGHVDSIVQLGKVAEEMRDYIDSRVTTQKDLGDKLVRVHNKLMHGEEG